MSRINMMRSAACLCGCAAALTLAGTSPAASGGGSCAPDLNGCGSVDTADLAILAQAWGPNAGHAADFNDDDVVNGIDLGFLLGHWGGCTETLALPETVDLTISIEEATQSPSVWDESLRTYDVFAELNDPDVRLLNVYDAAVTCDAAMCFHHADVLPPHSTPFSEQLWNDFDLTYDSFVTIGPIFSDDNAVMIDPSFLFNEQKFLTGESLGPDSGWLLTPHNEQGLAGTYPDNRIRVARLTVAMGAALTGEFTAMYQAADDALVAGEASFEQYVPLLSDLTGDGVVGGADLGVLLSEWGACDEPPPVSCPAGLNMDGSVGGAHLGTLLSNWTN